MTANPQGVRAVMWLRERPAATVLMALHRLLGLGVAEVRRRIDTEEPLVDVELFQNNRTEVADQLRALLDLIDPYRHEIHECIGDAPPHPGNRIDASMLRGILARTSHRSPVRHPAPRPIRYWFG